MEPTLSLPLITAYTAAILGILQITLMLRVGLARGATNITLGDGGNEILLYKIRRHANLTENAPIFLILLTLLEIIGGGTNIVLGLAVTFTLARFSHAYALSGPGKPVAARGIGAMGTLIGIIGSAGTLLWQLTMMH